MVKDVVGFEGLYWVSSDGVIKSKRKTLAKTKDRGYLYVSLHKGKRKIKKAIHRIVAEAFIQNNKKKPQVNHKNGNKEDNTVENLEWVTAKENCKHAWDNGLSGASDKMKKLSKAKMEKWNSTKEGKKHCSENGKNKRKLDKKQIFEILKRSDNGESAYRITKDYNVSKPTILKIIRRETYKEIINEFK